MEFKILFKNPNEDLPGERRSKLLDPESDS